MLAVRLAGTILHALSGQLEIASKVERVCNLVVVERADCYGGQVAEGEDTTQADLAGCFEGEEADGEKVEVVVASAVRRN